MLTSHKDFVRKSSLKRPPKMVLLAKRLDAIIAEREQKLRESQQREADWEIRRADGGTEDSSRGLES